MTPQAPAQQAQGAPPIQQMPGGINAIDPLAVPIPPELAGPVYNWVRRLALQADLQGADRVLRDALLDLSSSLAVQIVYPGPDGLWSLGADEEIPRDAQPLIAVAQARRAVVSSHTALIPVITPSETVAVVTVTRNPRNPAYHPIEQIAMIAMVRESAAILHHLAVAHLQKTAEINADKGGLYRGEALEAHRSRGNEGVPINLTPGWVRRAYPLLVGAMLIAIIYAIFVKVPTYSTGTGMIQLAGKTITAPQGGTVEEVYVSSGDVVTKGQPILKLHSANEEAELKQAVAEYESLITLRSLDQTDDTALKNLANAQARVDRASAAVEARIVRAPREGVISDRRTSVGKPLQPGEHIATVVDANTEVEILAGLPGKDIAKINRGMDLQIALVGEKKVREVAEIIEVGNEAIGAAEAIKQFNSSQADAIKFEGSVVMVRARLKSKSYQVERRTLWFHHGMLAVAEVKISNKPFLVTLIPALEKYVPEI